MPMELVDNYRRLPVYLVVDTSASMGGPPIVAVNQGLQLFADHIKQDQHCRDTVSVGVIRFDSDAERVCPLTEAAQFVPPQLHVGGGTALSLALKELKTAIADEMRPRSEDYPGDYKPMVFLFTDGAPNPGDPWREAADALWETKGQRPGVLVAIGAGSGVDVDMLKQLAPESTYLLSDLDSGKMQQLFKWIANSTVISSKAVGQVKADQLGAQLPSAPPDLFDTP